MEGQHAVVDTQVIEAARRGDREAVVQLWRTYQPQVLRFLQSIRTSAPEDVASQVWIDVGRTIDRFVGDGAAFQRWIFTIARNRSRDEARRVGRRREVHDDHRTEPRDAVFDPFEGIGSLDRAIETVSQLPPDMAEAVMLRVVYELPVADVAEILGRSQGNVRVLVHRGLHRLGEILSTPEMASR